MKINELKEKLLMSIPKEYIPCFFTHTTILGGYNIDKVDKFWRIYLCGDKGDISDMHYFTTESELCEYVYNFFINKYKKSLKYAEERERIEKNKKHIPDPPKVIYLDNVNPDKK